MRQLRSVFLATLLIPLVVLVSSLSAESQTGSTPQSSASTTVPATPAGPPDASSSASHVLAAKDIQGLDVFSSDGRQVGKIAKVNATNGTVKDVEVQSAGFLGFFSKTYLLPADKLSKKGGRLDLSLTGEQAKQFIK